MHQRKRIHEKGEAYPHLDKRIRFLDRIVLALAVVGPLSAIPQIYEIFATHEVAGISLLTWSFWEAISIPWFIYGIVHKDLAITVSSTFWFITQGAVIAGVLIYS